MTGRTAVDENTGEIYDVDEFLAELEWDMTSTGVPKAEREVFLAAEEAHLVGPSKTTRKFNESDWVRNSGRFADFVGRGGGRLGRGRGGSGATAAETDATPAVDESLRHRDPRVTQFELANRLKKVENAAVYPKDRIRGGGPPRPAPFETSVGDEDGVNMTMAQVMVMPGGTVTHNHPSRDIQYPLSNGDVHMAVSNNVTEIRAVTPEGFVSSLTAPPGGWPTDKDEMGRINGDIRARSYSLMGLVDSGRKDYVEGMNEMWGAVATKYGATYRYGRAYPPPTAAERNAERSPIDRLLGRKAMEPTVTLDNDLGVTNREEFERIMAKFDAEMEAMAEAIVADGGKTKAVKAIRALFETLEK